MGKYYFIVSALLFHGYCIIVIVSYYYATFEAIADTISDSSSQNSCNIVSSMPDHLGDSSSVIPPKVVLHIM